jgi:hypothetical protein
MSLLEEWAEAEGAGAAPSGLSGGGAGGTGALFLGIGADDGGADGGDDLDDAGVDGAAAPLFAIETLERDASHGQGAITAVAAAANVVLLGTASGALIRYDFAEGAATGACVLPQGAALRGGVCVCAKATLGRNAERDLTTCTLPLATHRG